MRLGTLELHLVSDGEVRLDGGAMFGVVPKPLWSREKPADELNRIHMGTHSLLVESGRELVLVDTGVGDKHEARFTSTLGMDPGARRLPEAIRDAGFELSDVTRVVLTHLHFDHCGWNTRRDAGGSPVPTFPRARYWLNRGEVEHARAPNDRDRSSYFPENWEPLFAAGVVELFDETAEIAPGVTARRVPGHNRDMCVVTLDGGSGDAQGIFFADLVPTTAHVPFAWVMSYDLFPLETMANKRHWIPPAAAGRWLCVFQHDADRPLGRIVEEKPGRFRAAPLG